MMQKKMLFSLKWFWYKMGTRFSLSELCENLRGLGVKSQFERRDRRERQEAEDGENT